MFLRYNCIWDNETTRQMIRDWLTRWMIDDWIKIRILFWSLNVWITSLSFLNAFSVSEFLTSSTNRELKIRIFADTSLLLIDKKTSFSNRSTISFCLNAMNDELMLMILKMTLTIDAKYFLNRPRSRFIDSMSTIESMMRFELVCSDDEDSRLDDMFNWSASNDDKFWSWWYDLTEVDLNLI
jgi:hypothetical protein